MAGCPIAPLTQTMATQTDAQGNFDPAHATLVDPFNGREDLARRRLRHVTEAFREDPVRILRVARFAARFADFHVAHDTLQLMRDMVAHGEAAALVAVAGGLIGVFASFVAVANVTPDTADEHVELEDEAA